MTRSIDGSWYAIAAARQFILPYLRAEHAFTGQFPNLNTRLNLTGPGGTHHFPLTHTEHKFREWVGDIYVEYVLEDDVIANPSRVEYRGSIRTLSSNDMAGYFALPPLPHTGLL